MAAPRRSTCGCKRCVTVKNARELKNALTTRARQGGRIVCVTGLIDVSEGRTSAEMESRGKNSNSAWTNLGLGSEEGRNFKRHMLIVNSND